MTVDNAKTLLDMIEGLHSHWQTLWTVFYTVAAALVALVASDKINWKWTSHVSIVFSIVFSIFAFGNYEALCDMRIERQALVEFGSSIPGMDSSLLRMIEASGPPKPWELNLYHWSLWLLVIALFWVLPKRSGEGAKSTTP
jgi:hypothetical protein